MNLLGIPIVYSLSQIHLKFTQHMIYLYLICQKIHFSSSLWTCAILFNDSIFFIWYWKVQLNIRFACFLIVKISFYNIMNMNFALHVLCASGLSGIQCRPFWLFDCNGWLSKEGDRWNWLKKLTINEIYKAGQTKIEFWIWSSEGN